MKYEIRYSRDVPTDHDVMELMVAVSENIARFATDVGTKIRRCLTCHRARSRDFQRRRRTAA